MVESTQAILDADAHIRASDMHQATSHITTADMRPSSSRCFVDRFLLRVGFGSDSDATSTRVDVRQRMTRGDVQNCLHSMSKLARLRLSMTEYKLYMARGYHTAQTSAAMTSVR